MPGRRLLSSLAFLHCCAAIRPSRAAVLRPRCQQLRLAAEGGLAVGDEVRVAASLVLFHVPGHKTGLDVREMTGVVSRIYTEANLSPVSPVKVAFSEPKKWTAHFDWDELELVSAPEAAAAAAAAGPPTLAAPLQPAARAAAGRGGGGDLVAQSMTPVTEAVLLEPDMPLRQAAELLTEQGITGAPVVSGGKLVGVLTQFDFLYQEAGSASLALGSAEWRSAVQKSLAGTVSAAMTRDPVHVAPDAEMAEVAALMVHRRFNHVPVVAADGTVVGIVTSPNVLRHVLSRLAAEEEEARPEGEQGPAPAATAAAVAQ